MQELIVISSEIIGSEEVNSVNARDLWGYLESKQQFGDWIKNRLSGFVEGRDYSTVHKNMNGGKFAAIEYLLTMDTAKHLALSDMPKGLTPEELQATPGHKLRQYFIQAEKNLRQISKEMVNDLPFAHKTMNLRDKTLRSAFYKAFNGKCYYTKKKLDKNNFHIDHIMPQSLGGQDVLSNLVLCDPSENSRKLNAYDASFVIKHQEIVSRDFAPLVYAIYISAQGSLVAPGINPTALLTAPMMTKMEKMFGLEATRDFYAKLIPGINYKKVLRAERDSVDEFIEHCIIEHTDRKRISSLNEIALFYFEYCEKNNKTALSDIAFRRAFNKRCSIAHKIRARIDGSFVRCLTVDLVS